MNHGIPIKIQVLADVDVFYMSAGKFHSAIIDAQKNIYVWGSNNYGQLGISFEGENALEPIYTEFNFDVSKISCGYKNTLLLTDECLVYGCGINHNQLILPDDVDIVNEFVLIEELHDIERIFCTDVMMALSKDYTAYLWGGTNCEIAKNNRPEIIEGFENRVINAALGSGFVILIDNDLFVYAAGENSKGQLGYSDTLKERTFGVIDKLCQNPLKSVACGKDFVLGLGGIIAPNPNKLRGVESQFNLDNNYASQIRKKGSQYGSEHDYNSAGDMSSTVIKKTNGQVFESFNSPNNYTNRIYQSEVPSFPEREETRGHSDSDNHTNNIVSDAVEGFKSEVYSILKDLKTQNPDIDKMVDKNKLKQLKLKEDLLTDILNKYASDGEFNSRENTNREIISVLRGIIAEYDKHVTFKGHKKLYRDRLKELKVP